MNLASRKFILCCAIVAISGALTYVGKLDGGGFVTLMTLVFGTYVGGNVTERVLKKPA